MSETLRNRLEEEQSPYLRQHADNPVHWQPWDERALSSARERDVPIFLSIGYSACHWCHVMEDESFADEEVAAALNENFVPIKVDREERPDLDSVYQTICQLVSGRGGWPLSVWLTPDGRPFYVGTYFPKRSKRGMPGFLDLLDRIEESWENDREEIERRADQWTEAVAGELESVPEQPSKPESDVIERAAATALRAADREHGGFGSDGPKFPQPVRLEVLARAYERTGRGAYGSVLCETLDAMADRGLYDHLGGGFHRYATDREWIVPHFEKMLYDNALLPMAYLTGWRLTGSDRYADVVRETFSFLNRELSHPGGGFYSTLDAQSPVPEGPASGDDRSGDANDVDETEPHGEEGAFYVWTPSEIEEILGDDREPLDAELFCERYGVTESGNFEGKNVLTLSASVDSLEGEYDLTAREVRDRLSTAKRRVFEARERRPRPRRDEKVLAGWNGLAISAFAEGGLALDPSYADRAVVALSFVREHLWDENEHRLSRRYKDGDVRIAGYLEDYAFLARGAFDCYQATGEVEHLSFALDLARAIESEFFDADAGTLYFTPAEGESLVARPQEIIDQSTPSSLAVAADVLLSLSAFAPEEGFEAIAETVVETHGNRLKASPLEHASLALVADAIERGPLEITLAADEFPDEWRRRLGSAYLPGRILAHRPPAEAEIETWLTTLALEETPPIWAKRDAVDGAPTGYVCRSFACSPPTTDPDEAISFVEEGVTDRQ